MSPFRFLSTAPPRTGSGKSASSWRRMALTLSCLAAALYLVFLLVEVCSRYYSQPGKGDNARITWGVMCRDGQCRPAALLYGRIPASVQPVIDLLNSRPEVKTLCLDSIGGNASAASDLAAWLVRHKYDTCLPQIGTASNKLDALCASACTHIFVVGQSRLVAPAARFQIHRGASSWLRELTGAPSADAGEISAPSNVIQLIEPFNARLSRLSQWINSIGLPQSSAVTRLNDEAAKTPSYQLRTVSNEQLVEWGVLTEPAVHEIIFKAASPK